MDLNEIQSLIKFVVKSGASEVELEQNGFKIIIKAHPSKGKTVESEHTMVQTPIVVAAPAPVQSPPAPVAEKPAAEAPKAEAGDTSSLITVKSPMIGTFYRAAGPGKPPFVNVGDEIEKGKPLCIIEAMKLFNEIESEVSGKIVKVLVDDATPVEYDQPLFLVKPN
jgi:acetyl-CoA carboxylase biotin carboxyl carrier protein